MIVGDDSQEPLMCRWNAYLDQPVPIDELLFRTRHSPMDQSLHSRLGVETTSGGGYALGWYLIAHGQGAGA
jgi:hypothetical protein